MLDSVVVLPPARSDHARLPFGRVHHVFVLFDGFLFHRLRLCELHELLHFVALIVGMNRVIGRPVATTTTTAM